LSPRPTFNFKAVFFDKKTLWFIGLLIFGFSLNVTELSWGLSGSVTWQPDAIEGEQTINHMPLLFKQWRHKYPRGQFLINWVFYQPLVDHWSKHPIAVKDPSGKVSTQIITQDRAKFLAAISRWIVVVMSLGTITAVFLTTLYLFGDYLSAWLAGFILSVSSLFVFYSSIGHIDVPFTFWYSWAGCFCVLAAKRNLWRFYIPAALCAAYAVCTKEGYSMYIVGLAVVFCILRSVEVYQKTANLRQATGSFLSLKSAVAGAAFAGLFLLMSGFLNGPEEFVARMKFMSSEPLFDMSRTQLNLLQTSFQFLYTSVGWPVLLVWAAGMVYLLLKNRTAFLFSALPLVIFYMLTVMRLHFVAPRYFVPACTTIAIITGFTLAAWLRAPRIPAWARYMVVFLICGLTVLYCIGLKLEMRNDTRNRVEAWAHEHISKDVLIGSGMKRWYAPRLKFEGYKLIDGWHSEGIQTSRGMVKVSPEYLITSLRFPCGSNYKDDSAFKKDLYDGKAGYIKVEEFRAIYFSPAHTLFSIAGWPYWNFEWVSPDVDVFRRNDVPESQAGR
jgi:hypothetical protein